MIIARPQGKLDLIETARLNLTAIYQTEAERLSAQHNLQLIQKLQAKLDTLQNVWNMVADSGCPDSKCEKILLGILREVSKL